MAHMTILLCLVRDGSVSRLYQVVAAKGMKVWSCICNIGKGWRGSGRGLLKKVLTGQWLRKITETWVRKSDFVADIQVYFQVRQVTVALASELRLSFWAPVL
jgi:hypothetical protein